MSNLPEKNPILEAIADWGDANHDKIYAAYAQKGGWEGWVQVELAIHLGKHFGGQGQSLTSREQYVYNGTNQKCDLLIETAKYNGEHFVNMFELKCESSGNANKFRTDVQGDCTKIGNGVWKYSPCTWWIIGFGVDKAVGDLVVKHQNLQAYHRQIKVGNGAVTLWWAKGTN
ncbi:hypothetical protein EV361DRAFT_550522 [Lentinula raphanica]|uniref:Uncharacterized protein n=1 Tax=Lentinula raphanica TaxID=153919 RepID=A0AA38P427_9AGAR|nr:hypothetical protein C8R42DRAFT_637227 [Lentinula raphanica]KAJ3758538.1 hypothetical protein EV360DRAFT_70240 [Lentinula raphanica]KAJ3774167.1 hypothetical protein FB446DRAFT_702522 [Lentinula raphanica]KAJ3816683.1 hypothetical protein F5880DRAFT_205260 [Lentinula raphanica]KAJ3835731.1 hypothetical protein F5878DRAFT_296401 [Lentinula raphanica]